MTNQELLPRLREKIILALHPECGSYEEALKKEMDGDLSYPEDWKPSYDPDRYDGLPLSLARVMAAIENVASSSDYVFTTTGRAFCGLHMDRTKILWQLTDDQGRELYLRDQSEETLSALDEIFTNPNQS